MLAHLLTQKEKVHLSASTIGIEQGHIHSKCINNFIIEIVIGQNKSLNFTH